MKKSTQVYKKLFSRNGETFAETLVALLIGVLALTMMPISIVTAARINNKIRTDQKLRTTEQETGTVSETGAVTIIEKNAVTGGQTFSVELYKDNAGYVYYEMPITALIDEDSD